MAQYVNAGEVIQIGPVCTTFGDARLAAKSVRTIPFCMDDMTWYVQWSK